MAGHSFTAGVKRRRYFQSRRGIAIAGRPILFDIERIEPIAIMLDGVIQKLRVAALSAVGAKYLAPANPRVLGCSAAAAGGRTPGILVPAVSTSSASRSSARRATPPRVCREHEPQAGTPG